MHILQATASSSLSLPTGTYIYAIAATTPSGTQSQPHQHQQFAAISSDDSLRLFDGHTLQPTAIVTAKSHDGGVTALKEYSGIGTEGFLLATAGRDGAVRLWDARARGLPQRASVEMRVGMFSISFFSGHAT